MSELTLTPTLTPLPTLTPAERLAELTAWTQRADVDLLLLAHTGTGGVAVYAPESADNATGEYLKITCAKPLPE